MEKKEQASIIKFYFQFLTLADKLLIAILLLTSFLSVVALKQFRQPGNSFSVSISGKFEQLFPLGKNQLLEIYGPLGKTKIQVENKKVRILSSPCPEKICAKTGWIQHVGEIIVCVPNKIVIRINGNQNGHFDVITQ